MENINWSDLSFGYMKTDYNVRCYYRDGKWGELEVSSSEIINIHMAATCLHYGQESFEGLKAFKGRDGKIRVFRMDENGKRMQSSSRGIKMAELPVEKFEEGRLYRIKELYGCTGRPNEGLRIDPVNRPGASARQSRTTRFCAAG